MMDRQDSTPIACEPVPDRPDKVRLIWPEGIKPALGGNGYFNRYHLAWNPGQGLSNCGEYRFFWHTVQHYVYGVCPVCGYVYVKTQRARHSAAQRAGKWA